MPNEDHTRHHAHGSVSTASLPPAPDRNDIVRDPVCGMLVDTMAGKPSATYAGRVVHFCSKSCRAKSMKQPEAYLKAIDPVFGTLLSPMLDAAAMSLSSVSVVGNALRLRSLSLK